MGIFGNIGKHGISIPAGLLVAHHLTLPDFEAMVNAVYHMEIPTTLNPEFECSGVSGNGCPHSQNGGTCKAVYLVGVQIPGHPLKGKPMCHHCRVSTAFDNRTREILESMEERTDEQQELLDILQDRRQSDNTLKLARYYDTRDTASARARTDARQANLISNEEARDARLALQRARDEERRLDGNLSNTALKYSKSGKAHYPWELIKRMCKGLVLFVRQFGHEEVATIKANDVLRAVLIRYHEENPDQEVVEYYAHQDGRNRPVYLLKEFERITKCYLTKVDPNGIIRTHGKSWWPKRDWISLEEIWYARQVRYIDANDIVMVNRLILSVVNQAFDDSIAFDPPDLKQFPQALLRDFKSSNIAEDWLRMVDGIVLSYQ